MKCRIAQRERESWINQLSWHEILSRRVLSFLDLMKSISKTNNTQRSRVASAIDLFPGRVRPRPSCLPERGPPENVEYFPYSTSPRLKKCNIVEDAATFSHRDGPPPLPRYLDRPASFNMQKNIESRARSSDGVLAMGSVGQVGRYSISISVPSVAPPQS